MGENGECHIFLAGNRAVLFWQPAFFWVGTRMTMVAFKKNVSNVISINGKKKFKRILVEDKKAQVTKTKLPSKDFIL